MTNETVATDRAKLLSGKSRVTQHLDVAKGFLERLQKEIEREEDDDYWKSKFGLFSSSANEPLAEETEVVKEDPESRQEYVSERSDVLEEPTETEGRIEATESSNRSEAVEPAGQQPDLLSSFMAQYDIDPLGDDEQREDGSVASKRSTGSFRSLVSKALSVASKKSTSSRKSQKAFTKIELPESSHDETAATLTDDAPIATKIELPESSHDETAATLTDDAPIATEIDLPESSHDEAAATLTDNAPTAMDVETINISEQKLKKKNVMKSILKSLKKMGKEKKEKKLPLVEVIPRDEQVPVSPGPTGTSGDNLHEELITSYSKSEDAVDAPQVTEAASQENPIKSVPDSESTAAAPVVIEQVAASPEPTSSTSIGNFLETLAIWSKEEIAVEPPQAFEAASQENPTVLQESLQDSAEPAKKLWFLHTVRIQRKSSVRN